MRIATRGRFEWNGTRYVFFEEAGFEYSGPLAETKGDKKVATDDNTKQALADSKAKSDAALKSQGSSVDAYKAAIAKVTSRDLYFNPQRQGMVRQAVATNTDAAQKNTEGQLSEYGLRTGVNTANIPATIAEGQRESQRVGHDTLVKDQLDQESKYEQAQQFGATALGQIPGIYSGNNSAALSYGSSALGAQASVDQQRVQPQTPWWQAVLGAGAQVGAAFVGKPPAK